MIYSEKTQGKRSKKEGKEEIFTVLKEKGGGGQK